MFYGYSTAGNFFFHSFIVTCIVVSSNSGLFIWGGGGVVVGYVLMNFTIKHLNYLCAS